MTSSSLTKEIKKIRSTRKAFVTDEAALLYIKGEADLADIAEAVYGKRTYTAGASLSVCRAIRRLVMSGAIIINK